MNRKETLQRYISEQLLNGRRQVNAEDELLLDNTIDSMGVMWLVAFIEEQFEVSIPLGDVTIQNFRNIQTIDNYLETLIP